MAPCLSSGSLITLKSGSTVTPSPSAKVAASAATVRSKLEDHLGRLIQLEASEQADRERYRESLRNGIEFIDTLVLGIKLPPSIVTAIKSSDVPAAILPRVPMEQGTITMVSNRAEPDAKGAMKSVLA